MSKNFKQICIFADKIQLTSLQLKTNEVNLSENAL
jgi:hypothetical protein